MNSFLRFCLPAVSVAVLSCGSAMAQAVATSNEVKVDVKKVEAVQQNTPQFSAPNVKDKRWNPKIWLELDSTFKVEKARVPGDTNPMVDSLEVKYFVVLSKRDKQGKYVMLTASITYVNVNEGEAHAMAFVSPAALARVLENPRFTAVEITPTGIGVEIHKGGALAGWYASTGKRFWESLDNFSVVDGVLLPKAKTPFAPLWGDYDLETKQ